MGGGGFAMAVRSLVATDQANQAAASADPIPTRQSELEALTTQARWLLEYHGRRTDSANQRAVAALAANGVLLGLIATAVRSASNGFGVLEQIAILLASMFVAVSAGFAIAALAPRKTAAPSVGDLQDLLNRSGTDLRGHIHRSVVLTLLGTPTAEAGENPVSKAAKEAADRVRNLKRSVWALGAAIGALIAFIALSVLLTP